MKHLVLFPLLTLSLLYSKNNLVSVENYGNSSGIASLNDNEKNVLDIGGPLQTGESKMSAAVFKSQEYCRVEMKDFEFDVHFSVVSATVYFSGANFSIAKKGAISSSSLKPISNLMAHCIPGSIVIFDDVKIVGPDKTVRSIPGVSLILY